VAIDWQEVITATLATVGGSGVLVGAAVWLMKTAISSSLAREADTFRTSLKADADTAIERVKTALQMSALEHQVRFSMLHEKRAEVIAEMYKGLVEAEIAGRRFVAFDGHAAGGSEKQLEAWHKAETKILATSIFIEQHRLYLPERVCTALTKLLETMREHVTVFGVYGSVDQPTPQTQGEKHEAFKKALDAFEIEIPAAKRALEDEFREILGVEKSRPPSGAHRN
jgi:hypothetical protein